MHDLFKDGTLERRFEGSPHTVSVYRAAGDINSFLRFCIDIEPPITPGEDFFEILKESLLMSKRFRKDSSKELVAAVVENTKHIFNDQQATRFSLSLSGYFIPVTERRDIVLVFGETIQDVVNFPHNHVHFR